MISKLPLIVAASVVAACGSSGPVAKNANSDVELPTDTDTQPDPTGGAPKPQDAAKRTRVPMPPSGKALAAIPERFHGRWGMAPMDCTSARGDAKGLLTITADTLRFYESTAKLGDNVQADGDSIRGDFKFTGEGQQWTRFQSLRTDGEKLIRSESNPSASYEYAKCA